MSYISHSSQLVVSNDGVKDVETNVERRSLNVKFILIKITEKFRDYNY